MHQRAIRKQSNKNKQPWPRLQNLESQLYTISNLILFSIFGTLARLGLTALTTYPAAPLSTPLLWANVGGSLTMGFLVEEHKLFTYSKSPTTNDEERVEVERVDSPTREEKDQAPINKKTVPLYVGLTTGFCGSFTSFSSFVRDAYLALANSNSPPHRNGGYSFLALLAVIITTVGLSLGALVAGTHLAIAAEPVTPPIPTLFTRKIIDRTVVFLAWGCWLGAVFMSVWPPDRPGGSIGRTSWDQETWRGNAVYALVFAPVGCVLRFYASFYLNGRFISFPIGTFAVNVAGTMLEGMFYDVQHVPLGGRVGCQVLQGLQDGLCGCLTTVSTWVAELKALKLRHAYVYGIISVAAGLGVMVIEMGSLQWTRGYAAPRCMVSG
ncbi:MAG: hypothetical protein Q9190_003487 [Brigantiaea leucoxantha]